MKLAEFNDLCHREHERDGGIVTRLTLGPDEYAELCADVLSGGVTVTSPGGLPDGPAGVRLTQIINPATMDGNGHPLPVAIERIATRGFDFTGGAEVTRWVSVVAG